MGMLTVNETLLAVVRNIEQWDFALYPKFSLNENEARAVADELEKIVAKQIVADYQIRNGEEPDLDCALRD